MRNVPHGGQAGGARGRENPKTTNPDFSDRDHRTQAYDLDAALAAFSPESTPENYRRVIEAEVA